MRYALLVQYCDRKVVSNFNISEEVIVKVIRNSCAVKMWHVHFKCDRKEKTFRKWFSTHFCLYGYFRILFDLMFILGRKTNGFCSGDDAKSDLYLTVGLNFSNYRRIILMSRRLNVLFLKFVIVIFDAYIYYISR